MATNNTCNQSHEQTAQLNDSVSGDAEEPPLTFQPAVDDKDRLSAFLRGVCDKYNAQRDQQLQVFVPDTSEAPRENQQQQQHQEEEEEETKGDRAESFLAKPALSATYNCPAAPQLELNLAGAGMQAKAAAKPATRPAAAARPTRPMNRDKVQAPLALKKVRAFLCWTHLLAREALK